jgi:hypothetical protein
LTAWAHAREDFVPEDFVFLPWREQNWNGLRITEKRGIKARLEWMHINLPLTAAERDSLVYACKQSQLVNLGPVYLDSLLDLPQAEGFSKKAPRNPASRRGVELALARDPSVPLEDIEYDGFEDEDRLEYFPADDIEDDDE